MLDVSTAVLNVTLSLVGLGAAAATYYLKKGADKAKIETDHIQDQAKAKKIWDSIERVEDAAQKAVAKTENTIAGQLRQAVKDGKMDRSNLVALGPQVVDEVLRTVGPDVVQILTDNMGDLKAYVVNTVEDMVEKIKNKNA